MRSKIKNVILVAQILFVLLLVPTEKISAFASVANDSAAEEISLANILPKISLDLSNVSLKDALKAIEQQIDYKFMYNNSIVNLEQKLSIQCVSTELDGVLNPLFAGNNISYKICISTITDNSCHPYRRSIFPCNTLIKRIFQCLLSSGLCNSNPSYRPP